MDENGRDVSEPKILVTEESREPAVKHDADPSQPVMIIPTPPRTSSNSSTDSSVGRSALPGTSAISPVHHGHQGSARRPKKSVRAGRSQSMNNCSDESLDRRVSRSFSMSSNSSEMLDDFPESDNKTREREMWAMLAGQTAFKFESYIFQRVLPKSLIKPHIFPRHVEDMETLIEKYTATGKSARLDGAAEKWTSLKREWKWRKAHGLVIGTAKSAYLHISNPLEVMMKLDRERGDSLEDARRAYRNVLPPKLQESGQEVVDLMHSSGLLTDKSSPPSPT